MNPGSCGKFPPQGTQKNLTIEIERRLAKIRERVRAKRGAVFSDIHPLRAKVASGYRVPGRCTA
jgi:hypothetical protein